MQEQESNELGDLIKEELDSRSDEAVCMNPEPSGSAGARVSEAAMAGLYADHVVKHELVLDPERGQHPPAGGDSAAAMAGLYADHVVKHELVLGPERGQHPPAGGDSAAAMAGLYADHVVKHELVLDPERGQHPPAGGDSAAAMAGLYADHVVKHELVLGPERPYRPHMNLLHESCGGQLALKECSVSLERWHAPRGAITREPAPASQPSSGRDIAPQTRSDQLLTNTYVCDICGKFVKQKDHLIRHVNMHLRENSEILSNKSKQVRTSVKTYACKICNKEVSALNYLLKHQRVHTRERLHSCEICQKKFAHLDYLTAHKRVHTGKLYSCDICKKTFSFFSSLKRHTLIHTAARPYLCEICEKRFMRLDAFKIHLRSHRGGKSVTEQRKSWRIDSSRSQREACPVSWDSWARLEGFQPAETTSAEQETVSPRTITLEHATYACDICNKTFTRVRNLRRHKQIHTGEKTFSEKPFSCDICKQRFRQLVTLTNHKRIHTGERPYSCGICKKKFTQQGSLKRHLRRNTHKRNVV